ncbi:MAG: hypothetical protein HY856_08425 [Burkholderiales bacterium]|nr:hypothetical protein [Burkholderiales bacterium]
MSTRLPRTALLTTALAATLCTGLLAGCGKVADSVSEAASEKAAEKMIEAQINQNGGNAKVDLSSGGVTAEGTDENGKAFKMEMGNAKVTEQELGLPFYPGAQPVADKGTRMRNGEMTMATVELSSDAEPQKVAEWYRGQLKGRGEGATVVDSSSNGELQLMIVRDKPVQESMQVHVTAASEGGGSTITLMHSSGK